MFTCQFFYGPDYFGKTEFGKKTQVFRAFKFFPIEKETLNQSIINNCSGIRNRTRNISRI